MILCVGLERINVTRHRQLSFQSATESELKHQQS